MTSDRDRQSGALDALDNVRRMIEEALERHAHVDAQRLHVETHGGSVILSGTVHSQAERREAERAAWSAPGVSAVNNLIAVDPR